jgi:hypothetical protein
MAKLKCPAARGIHMAQGVEQQRRAAIGQFIDKMGVEPRGILVEQPAHITIRRPSRRRCCAEPGKMKRAAKQAVAIEFRQPLEGDRRALHIARLFPRHAKREPGGRPLRRVRDDLLENIGGDGMRALVRLRLGPGIAAIEDNIAGRLGLRFQVRCHIRCHVTIRGSEG